MDDIPDEKPSTDTGSTVPPSPAGPAIPDKGLREVHPEGETRNGAG